MQHFLGAEVQDLYERGKTDEEIDDRFHRRPRAEDHVDDVQVTAEEVPESDESPVEGTDHDEDVSDLASRTACSAGTSGAAAHRENSGKGINSRAKCSIQTKIQEKIALRRTNFVFGWKHHHWGTARRAPTDIRKRRRRVTISP